MRLLGLATALYNRPLLVTWERAKEIEAAYQAHAEGRAALLTPPIEPKEPRIELAGPGIVRADAGYYRTADGVAIIPVVGTLVQRGDSLDAMSGLLSYGRIATMLQAAVDDPRTDAILLEIDSPGGEANGLMDLAGKVRAAAQRKPVHALANEQAFSAAYWLASSAAKVFTPQTGMVGSVGVVMLHVDQSGRDAKQGLVYTPIFAGAHKVDFSSHAPLSDEARALAQEEVDRLYEMFVQAVADGRGIDAQAVRDTQAGLLNPQAALAVGFIDGVQSFDQTLSALAAEAKQQRYRGMRAAAAAVLAEDFERAENRTAIAQEPSDFPQLSPEGDQEPIEMATNEPKGPSFTAEDLEKARADERAKADADAKKLVADAQATAAKAASERVLAILGHEEAKERQTLAHKLASTDMTLEQAVDVMKSAAKETPAKASLATRMAGVPNPKVGAGADVPAEQPKTINTQDIYAKRRAQSDRARAA